MALTLNQHDLEFILKQIKIAEAHSNGIPLTEIRIDVDGSVTGKPNEVITDPAWYSSASFNPAAPRAIPDPKTPFGLRTVDGSYNNIVEGRELWGAADQIMPRMLDPNFRDDADGDEMPLGPPGGPVVTNTDYGVVGQPSGTNGGHTGNVADADPRIISNLIVSMTVDNPAAVAAWLNNELAVAAFEEKYGKTPVRPGTLVGVLPDENGIIQNETQREITNEDLALIPNIAPDEGISAPFNGWMTFFGQFFDHGLDLITKGNNGTIFVPLQPNDPLVLGPDGQAGTADDLPPHLRFMALTRATPVTGPGPDGIEGTDDDSIDHINTTTPFVDQNQTYTSHPSHQVFLREYEMVDGKPVATGRLLNGANGGLPTWADVKQQAAEKLGIVLSDMDVFNIPLLRTDPYGKFIPNEYGFPQIIIGLGADGIPNTADDEVVSATIDGNGTIVPVVIADLNGGLGVARTSHAFLDDIAHAANPIDSQTGQFKLADADGNLGTSPLLADDFQSVDLSSGSPGVNEDPLRGNWTLLEPPGWNISGLGGLFDPTPTIIGETGHGGGNVVFLDGGASLARNTGISLEAGRNYVLKFNVGDRSDQGFGGGEVRLLTSDGTVLSSTSLTAPADSNWASVTVSTGPIGGAAVGKELRIEIIHGGGSGQQILIDDVQLTDNSPVYDNELLDRHFITGDGRGNENIGLTAVHHVFHSEHNRQVELNKKIILETGDLDFINEWLVTDLTPEQFAAWQQDPTSVPLHWDGERLFQTARFATEMQYQHLVFEEFARRIEPSIDPFVFNSVTDINPAIFAEFANTVYRFGHSMLTDTVGRIFLNEDGTPMVNADWSSPGDLGLIEAFLNPVEFDKDGTLTAEEAAGAIVRGMTLVHGNEIDEFVVDSLRNNLLGLPLDLAAINIARGRDTGVPTLNEARAQLYAATGSSFLKPYDSWVEFAANLKTPASVINFIAAYGKFDTIQGFGTDFQDPGDNYQARRALAMDIVLGGGDVSDEARIAFLNGPAATTGVNDIDLWIGGLAERILVFGGMLGSTFRAIFEAQLENLQDADRFYYLTRTQGLNFLNELENNSFSKLITANTDLIRDPGPDGIRGTPDDNAGPDGIVGTDDDTPMHHIGVDAFTKYDYVLEANQSMQIGDDPEHEDEVLNGLGLKKVMRSKPLNFDPDGFYDNYLRFIGPEHVVLGGTNGNDVLIGDLGDDAIWGDAGDDRIEGGQGVDLILGGAGDDVITDEGDAADFIKGEEGDDVIVSSNGLGDILMGGDGKDVIFAGVDGTEVFGGEGDDFILGGDDVDFLMGNEGDDWIEGGKGFDTIAGDNSELFFNSTILGHDVMFAGSDEQDFDAESGDDIMVQGESVIRNEGMFGFDWATFQGAQIDGYADMRIKIFTTEEEDILRNRFDKVEALSGWERNDTLIGDDRVAAGDDNDDVPGGANTVAANENVFFKDELSQAGVDRIDGLRELLGNLIEAAPENATPEELEQIVAFTGGNILLGGGGNDILQGNGGNDFLDGDSWLNVRIRITGDGEENSQENEIATITSLKHTFSADPAIPPEWHGKSLIELLIARVIKPNQLHIVREILDGGKPGDIDTAVFRFDRSQYSIVTNDDGTVTVTHLTDEDDPLFNDGVDTLRNIELLQFADQVVQIAPGGPLNQGPIGQPVIDGVPQIGRPLTIRLNEDGSLFGVIDPDNVSATNPEGRIFQPFVIEWQIEDDPGIFVDTGARGLTFTPTAEGGFDDEDGERIRAVVRYTDANGIPNSVASAPTDPLIPGENLAATEGDDVLVGTEGPDDINGFGGNDTIFGLGGDDRLIGGPGDDDLDGGEGVDTAVFAGPSTDYTFEFNAEGQLEVVHNLTGEEDVVTNIERFQFDDLTLTLEEVLATLPTQPTEEADQIIGTDGDDDIEALGGNDEITAGDGDDTIAGGAGDDVIDAGDGDDRILWEAGDGRDIIDGGGGTDELRIRGSTENETFFIETVADYLARTGSSAETLQALTDIVVSRSVGGGPSSVIAELNGIEEIDINGGGGNDTFVVSGNFVGTDLDPNTIRLTGSSGDDTVDISNLRSQHRVVFQSNGGNDTVIGTLRVQDVVDPGAGLQLSSFTIGTNPDGTKTLSNGPHTITFNGGLPPALQGLPSAGGFTYTAQDLAWLKALVQGQEIPGNDDAVPGVRTLSGHGNNLENPHWGAADEPFIRLTEARYGAMNEATGNRDVNPIFKGLDPRAISNILGDQEDNLAPAKSDANIFFMAFGQYFDHGLDFIAKGGNGTINIGGPGTGHDNPADLTRATVAGWDGDVPQHVNKTSPFVDQNQAYGSHELVGQFLRESDGNGGYGAKLLAGAPDPSNPAFKLLPTLRELLEHHIENETVFGNGKTLLEYYPDLKNAQGGFDPDVVKELAADFMGSGHALLLDTNPFINLLDHYVAGDGRANENFALTSMHTIWARNHNFHVDRLLAAGFEGTPEELFQAAKMINEAEYQRVVFDEFADMLLGGMRGDGTHGHEEYNPDVDARISHEFAAAAYRFGHSLVGQTMTIIDSNGQPKQVALFDAFLNPSNDSSVFTGPLPPGYVPQPGYAQLGVSSILGGIAKQPAEEVDFNIVDAVRNDLVRINADLFSFNVARGWDVGLGTLNQIRADLKKSTDPYVVEAVSHAGNLDPYVSWEDFQLRNGLSDAVIAQFKQAYPDLPLTTQAEIDAFKAANPDIELLDGPNGTKVVKGIDRVDLWVGGLAEKHINGGVVGQTFWVIIHEQLDRLQEGDRFYYTDRFDNFDFYEDFIDGQQFSDIIARNTGLTGLPEHIFEVDDEDDDENENENENEEEDDDNDTDNDSNEDDDDSDDDDEDDEQKDDSGSDDDEVEDEDENENDETEDDEEQEDNANQNPPPGNNSSALPYVLYVGTEANDTRMGGAGNDTLTGELGDDTLFGLDGDDNLAGGEGNDVLVGGAGNDILIGNGGNDTILAGAGDDTVLGGSGDDVIQGDGGNDLIFGDQGRDVVDAGAGNDTIFATVGDGDDVYNGGDGIDTLDMSAIAANIEVNLATGRVVSNQTGTDTINGVENVIGGGGDDTIIANTAVNVLDGGAGFDTFVFTSAAAANGDRIEGFEPGDLIDLRPLYLSLGLSSEVENQLASGNLQLTVDGEDTLIQGNLDADPDAEFTITVVGRTNLTGSDFA